MKKLLFILAIGLLFVSLVFPQKTKISGNAKVSGKISSKTTSGGAGLTCADLASQSVTDDFNRANNADLGTAWTSPIRSGNGACSLDGNMDTAGVSTTSEYYNVSTYKDPTAYLQITTATSLVTNDSPRLFFNLIDGLGTANLDGYILNVNKSAGTDTWNVQRIDNNTPTTLTPTTGVTTQEFAANDWMGIVRVDSSGLIRACYKPSAGSWTELATFTDTTYQTAGNVGIGFSLAGDVRADNFSIAAH